METVREEAGARSAAARPPRRSRWRELLLARPAFAATAAAVLVALGIGVGALVGALGGGDERAVHTAQVDRARVPGGTAELVVDDGSATLRVRGMPAPPRDHVYEVWLRRGNRVEPSSLFTVARDGSGAAAIPEGVDGVDEVMVTREPEGGSAKPSEAAVIAVDL
jgi:anti-sigma-K factor RskA